MRKINTLSLLWIAWNISLLFGPNGRIIDAASNKAFQSKTEEGSNSGWSCFDKYSKRKLTPMQLCSSEILGRVIKRKPIIAPSSGKFGGRVDLKALVSGSGRVLCALPLNGNPIAIDAVLNSFKQWTFRPYRNPNGKKQAFFGTVSIILNTN